MSTIYVAIDVETTGLDPRQDAIIDVAAVTFQASDLIDSFHSLVYPRRDIPTEITKLTGITDEMVADAPTMPTLRSKLRQVLDGQVLVGHNIAFDLAFLREDRLGIGNHRIDTLTLASILVPEAGRLSLNALADTLFLPIPSSGQVHRALEDAELTVELFLALRERALRLPLATLEEIVRAGQRIRWPETLFFEEALAERARQAFQGAELRQTGHVPKLFDPPKLDGRPLVPHDDLAALDIPLITDMIQPDGHFSRVFEGFEYRQQQHEMMEAVAQAFNDGDHVLLEAGTGTGKSIAYLLPAAFWATQNGRRVVISTNTINLQDQLLNKDIPQLQKCLPFPLRAAVRKGRSNYLCTRLFQQMRHSGPSSEEEMVLFARILLWLPHTETGDVSELPLRGLGERLMWSRLSGENAVCTSEHCASERCPLHLARQRAEQSHIVIVNHALLLADAASENHVLPAFTDLIIDEAHHLESAVTSGMSFRADRRFLETVLEEITKPRAGLLAEVQRRLKAALPGSLAGELDKPIIEMRREAEAAVLRLDDFFDTVSYFLQDHLRARSQFAQEIRITPALRSQPNYDEVELAWQNLNKPLKLIGKHFDRLSSVVAEVAERYGVEDEEELRAALLTNARDLEETRDNLNKIIAAPEQDMIYWVEVQRDRVALHAAPLHVGPLVERHIFREKETVILTSATLRTAGPGGYGEANFDYLRDRLHAHDANELAVGSPFDYRNSTLLYLCSDIPEPNQPGYQRYVEQAVIDVALSLGGRTMVLFTSYSQLRQTMDAVEAPLAAAGITTLAQVQGTSRQQLLSHFKADKDRTVLLGTRSFWEGVDVPGEALQALVIARLPFDVPSDPVFAARSETFDNSFFEYSVPEAVLRFRQGFGRLIRRGSDEGIVVVLDKRLLTKRYGQMFIESLPECTVIRQRTDRLGELSQRWLNRDKSRSL